MSKPLIGLLDCNNFFVSCERLFRPDLIGKPVLVLSSNDGCVVARSQEVKDIGVLMGVPYFQIKDIVEKHGITTFSSHFALYRDISRRVFCVMRAELDVVELYSIDEAFFAVTGDPEEVARGLKLAVERQVGIPVSVGIAATKTMAKYANQVAKKSGGVKVLVDTEWQQIIPHIPLSQIWGVGGNLELAYKRHGLIFVADLLATDRARIEQLFGLPGLRLQAELAGTQSLPLEKKSQPQQSIMHSQSFAATVSEYGVLADAVAYHVRHAAADLRAMHMKTNSLRVFIQPSRHGTFFLQGASKEVVLPIPTADTITLLRVAEATLTELYTPRVPYKKAGITLGGLIGDQVEQGSLFTAETEKKTMEIMTVIDSLNATRAGEVILLGSHLQENRWRSRLERKSPAYTTRWSEIREVQAN